ncbi:hypothetical protein T01_14870 [Trichinella spiralis]|uniref:Uncharacterized protein n=1 Tax=Trichinella spiralis TaxID=6334 RepID=A0A0V0Y3H3_TRISP|nr:hypothetical protein T01_14870 [Trichinella spiralis]
MRRVDQNLNALNEGMVWYYSVPLFSHWSLPTLFYWTVKS